VASVRGWEDGEKAGMLGKLGCRFALPHLPLPRSKKDSELLILMLLMLAYSVPVRVHDPRQLPPFRRGS
jgi:hypothetical protein